MLRTIAIILLLTSITNAINISSLIDFALSPFKVHCKLPKDYISGDDIQPLILQRNAFDQLAFVYPNHDGLITIPKNDVIFLVCPRHQNHSDITNHSITEIEAVCERDTLFRVEDDVVDITTIACRAHSTYLIRRTSTLPCPNWLEPAKIGFNTNMGFVPILGLCFDNTLHRTPITYFKMSRVIGTSQISSSPSQFNKSDLYSGIDLDHAYYFDIQLYVISEILESRILARRYLKKTFSRRYPHTELISNQYLTRGHLAAKADFVYAQQQRSTFWYENTAPQWRTFNNGNWNNLEKNIRQFANGRSSDLDVYTGVHGHMSMQDVHQMQKPISLVDGNVMIPVPRFFWKIVYDPSSKQGTAFVGLNDPFIRRITQNEYLCTDISKEIKWLKLQNPRNIRAGVIYACNINDLGRVVWLPPLKVNGIL